MSGKNVSFEDMLSLMKQLGMDVDLAGVAGGAESDKVKAPTAVKPFTPEDARRGKRLSLPPEVIDAFNDLLSQNYGSRIVIKQADAIQAITARLPITKAEIYENKFLDVEEVYRDAGWKVEYTKPDYTESFDPYFVFTPPKS